MSPQVMLVRMGAIDRKEFCPNVSGLFVGELLFCSLPTSSWQLDGIMTKVPICG